MIEKLVIIFALIYAFHGVVNGSEIKSDDRQKSPEKCCGNVCFGGQNNRIPCIYGYYDGMCTHCALTGKLHKQILVNSIQFIELLHDLVNKSGLIR